MFGPPRGFIEEETFALSKAALATTVQRLDDVLSQGGLLLQLCRNPEGGAEVPGLPGVYVRLTGVFPGAPKLAVLYSFDPHFVHGLWIATY